MIKLSEEDAGMIAGNDEVYGEADELLYSIEQEGEWVNEGKYQYTTVIFKDEKTGKLYRLEANRTGSHFTDWDYGFELDCPEVQRKERVITQVYYE